MFDQNRLSRYLSYTPEQWSRFKSDEVSLELTESDLLSLSGVNEVVEYTQVSDIYLPLAKMIQLYFNQSQALYDVMSQFSIRGKLSVPYVVGVSGSVAVGKSTAARVLEYLLQKNHPEGKVVIVPTDGFLYSNQDLEKMGLTHRKGFPESYDTKKLLNFLYRLKSGERGLSVPVYSHHIYDIVPDKMLEVGQPEIIILEGLNILQLPEKTAAFEQCFVSDFIDFSVFVDATESDIQDWFINRVLTFYQSAFKKEDAYFHFLTKLTPEEVRSFAARVWREVNALNYRENILPYKYRAQCILEKDGDHRVKAVYCRKLL